ncbi:MAG: hypothetical protein AAF569_05125, partial [Pseudomonadota bacterium]
MKRSENGSAIFYILIAIVLLAALTYSFTQSTRTSGDNLTDQQASLIASEIIEYGNTITNAVQKLKLRGCADDEISVQRD